jgi:hypothetical protein
VPSRGAKTIVSSRPVGFGNTLPSHIAALPSPYLVCRRVPAPPSTAFLDGESPQKASRGASSPFVRAVWPQFLHGAHHNIIADVFEPIEIGQLRRCILNLAPRPTKAKFRLPAVPCRVFGPSPPR